MCIVALQVFLGIVFFYFFGAIQVVTWGLSLQAVRDNYTEQIVKI